MKKVYLFVVICCLMCIAREDAFAQTSTFNYSGTQQSYTVPLGIYAINVDAIGGCGGIAYQPSGTPTGPVSFGGRVQCVMAVTPGQILYVNVGGLGQNDNFGSSTNGGYNGGVNGGAYGAASGGGTDLRFTAGTITSVANYGAQVLPYTATNRAVVAGGGGGGGDYYGTGGSGGGLTGGQGLGGTSGYNAGGSGGTQTGPGPNGGLGVLGVGAPLNSYNGGGGGYWGGNSRVTGNGGAGGGSSYTDPVICANVIHTQGYILANGNGKMTITSLTATANATPSSLAFNSVSSGTTSPIQLFGLSAYGLTAGSSLTITPPANFQVSLDNTNWSTTGTPLVYNYSASNFPGYSYPVSLLNNVVFYVRFISPVSTGLSSGNITVTGGGLASTLNIPVSGTSAAACSGSPTAGAATINGSASATGGASTAFTLNVPGASTGGNITYQWQVSTTSAVAGFGNIVGANSPSFVYTGLGGNTWFQCVVSCGASSATSGTVSASLVMPGSSCTPSCASGNCSWPVGTSGSPFILTGGNGTSISDASNCGSGTGGSSWYYNNVLGTGTGTPYSVILNPGGMYSATYGLTNLYYSSSQTWIDFNDNGVFETSESVGGVYLNSNGGGGGRQSYNISVPPISAGSTYGAHRMRVMAAYTAGVGSGNINYPEYPVMNPCPNSSIPVYYADTRDYTAIIANPLPTMNVTPTSVNLGNVSVGTSSAPVAYFTLNGSNLNPSFGIISVTCPVGSFRISTDGANWSNLATFSYSGGVAASANVYVQFNPTAVGPSGTTISVNGGGFASTISVSATGTGQLACTGTPTPGTASINASAANTLTPLTLSLAGTSTSGGLTFQWQSSPTGSAGSFTNISGALIPTYNFVGVSAATYFQCVVTCPTGSSATSNVVSVPFATSPAAPSCVVPPTPASGICTGCGFYIAQPGNPFICPGDAGTQINDNTTIPTAYGDMTSTFSCTMHAGTTYTTTIGGAAGNTTAIQFWIDFNNNGIFEPSESVGGVNSPTYTLQHPVLTIPAGIPNGAYRLRAMLDYNCCGAPGYSSYPGLQASCPSSGSPYYYEVRDYKVIFGPAPPPDALPCAGVPRSGIVSPLLASSCTPFTTILYNVGETVSNSGLTYQWQTSTSSSFSSPVTIFGASGQGYVPAPVSTVGTTYYRQTVTCTNSGVTTNSLPVAISLNANPTPITGVTNVCTGLTTTLSSTPSGGVWTSSNSGQATVGSTGIVTGITAGTVPNITYTIPTGGCFVTTPVTVNLNPLPISGSSPLCGGLPQTYTDATSGGAWSSGNPFIASVGSGTGVVTGGTSGGATTISYTSSSGCSVIYPVTVSAFAPITGSSSVCIGYSTSLSDAVSGGTWTSSNTAVATVNSSGLVTSVAVGESTISYVIGTCTSTKTINVTGPPIVYSMSGGGSYCSGATATAPHVLLNGSDAGVSYQLYVGGTPVGVPVTGTGFYIDFGVQTSAGCYNVMANPGSPCATPMIGTSCVTIIALPTAFSVVGGGNYCVGVTASAPHVLLTGSTIGVNYQLFVGSTPVGSPVAGTGASIDFGTESTVGVYTVVGTSAISGCTINMAGSVTVGTNPLPAPQTVTVGGGGGYCLGGAGQPIGLLSSVVGTSYQLKLGGSSVGSPVAGTGSAITFGNQTTGGIYTVVATIAATGCTATMSGSPTITVNPLPTAFTLTGGGAYCLGSATGVNVGLNGSTTNVNYQLYYTPSTGPTVAVGGPVPGTGFSFNFPGPGIGGTFTNTGAYSVVATNVITGCTGNMTGSASITTNPLPTVFTLSGGGGYCAGAAGVAVNLSGSVIGTTYQLYLNGGLVGALSGTGSGLAFGPVTAPGVYTVTGTVTSPATGCTQNMSGTATVTINPLPLVQTVGGGGNYCAGYTTGFPTVTLGSSQSGVSYQLYNGATPVLTPVAGTGSGLTFTFTSAPAAGSYTVIGTTTSTGCTNNMTGSVVIGINPLPTIYAVTGGGGYCAGPTGVHIGVSASNAGISYALKLGAATITSATGTGAAVDYGLITTIGAYSVLATNATTLCTVNMSGTASVSINALPNATYTLSAVGSGSYCAGGTGVSMALSNTETGVNYQLMKGAVPSGIPMAGTGSAVTFPAQTAPGTYTVVATNATTGCTANETGSVVVSINAVPLPQTVTGGGAYCATGAGMVVGLLATQSGVSYQLMNGAATVGSPVIGIGSALSFPPATGAGTYTVVATNGSGCTALMSGSAAISINPLPTPYAITEPAGSAYCTGGTGVPIGLFSTSVGTNYQLMLAGSPVGAPMAGTGVGISFGLKTAAGSYSVIATNATTGCQNTMTGTAPVTISTAPASHTITSVGTNYCPGGAGVPIGLDGSSTATNYQLYVGSTATGAPVAGTGSPISFGPQTTTGLYTVVANNGCVGNMAGSVTVGLYTLPVVFNMTGGGNFCPGGTGVTVGLSGSSIGVSYQLSNGSGPVGPALPGTGYALNFGLQTTGGVYTVVAASNTSGCTSNMSGSANVVINPLPAAHTVTGGGDYCMGTGGVLIGLDGSNIGTHYQLYIGGSTPVGTYMSGTGLPLNFGMQTTAGTYTILATSTSTTCNATMTNAPVINIIALPTVYTVTGGGNYCAGGSGMPVGLELSETGVNYQLYNALTPVGIAVAGTGAALDFGMQTGAGTYTVKASNVSTGCSNTMSGGAVIGVNTLPVAYAVTGGGNYCAGGTGVHVMLGGSNVGVNYQVKIDGVPSGLAMAGTGSSLDFGLWTAAGVYTIMAQNSTTSCSNTMTGSVTVGINTLPNVYTVIGTGTNYCAGGPGINVALSSSDAGINYQLYVGSTSTGTPYAGIGFRLDFGNQTTAGFYTAVAIDPATGCNATMSGGANVVINPLPTSFTVTGGGGYCNGGTGVSVGLNSSNVGISYQLWNGASMMGAPVMGTGFALNFGPQTVEGTYTVIASNMATSCSKTMSGSAPVVINPLPTVYTVTGGGNYCAGGSGMPVGISGSTAGVNYQLYRGVTAVGAPMPGSGIAISFGSQTAAGTYTVMAMNATTGCANTMTGSVTIGINSLPTAYAVTGGGNYCPGGAGVNVGIGGSNTGITYQLYNGAAPVGSAWIGTGSAISFGLQTAAGSYTVIATNNTTSCTANMSGTVTVGLNPLPNVYSVMGGGSYCEGGDGASVGLNNSSNGVNYQLLLDGGPLGSPFAGVAGPLDFGHHTAAGVYTVVATSGTTGCTNNMSGSATIVVNSLVPTAVTISTGLGDTLCSGHLITITALATGGGTSATYSWAVNGTPQAATGNSLSYLPGNGDVVTATLHSSAACASPANVSTSMSLTVLENGVPSVTVTATPGDSVCQGTSVSLSSATVFGGTPALTWVVNGNNVSTATNYSYVPANGDVVYVSMTSNYRCRSANIVQSNHVTMAVLTPALPVVNIVPSSNGANIAKGQQLTLTAYVTNGGSAPTYQWLINGAQIPGANMPTYTSSNFSNGDSITCQVVGNGTCSGLTGFNSITVHVSSVGVQQISSTGGDVQLLPNPNKGAFTVKGTLGTTADEEVSFEITNMLGQVIYNSKVMTHGGNINERIQLNSNIANGMYILNLRSDSDNKVFHIVIEQ